MLPHRLIVIGASAGGTQPLLDLAADLPEDFPAAICVCTHVSPHAPSNLPDILNRVGPLPASHPGDGEPIRPGRIYCAPSDHHLLIDDGHLGVKKGPKENRHRPCIDTLFRSAGYSEGPGAIGVILSGMLDDGTSGLWTIKRFGGVAVVQDPADAEYDSMPRSALKQVEVDHKVAAKDLASLLARLASEPHRDPWEVDISDDDRKRVQIEVSIASSDRAFAKGVMDFGKVTPQTCPECAGVLVQIREGGFTRYRCHTGHAYSGDTLLVAVTEEIEAKLWHTMRVIEEATMLLRNTGEEFEQAGDTDLAREFERRAKDYETHLTGIFRAVVENETLSAARLKSDVHPGD